jgi:hypothetical protein
MHLFGRLIRCDVKNGPHAADEHARAAATRRVEDRLSSSKQQQGSRGCPAFIN